MKLVRDASCALADLGAIRASATDFVSNYFVSPAQLQRWADEGRLRQVDAPDCLILLRSDGDFCHLYFAASTLGTLRDALGPALSDVETALACDVVGRPTDIARIVDCLSDRGFSPRARLARMARQNVGPGATADAAVAWNDRDDVEFVRPCDAPEVHSFLSRLLDRYAERIPQVDEISVMAEHHQVLVCRREGKIAGVLLFDRHGLSAHLRYWWIDAATRGRGIGSRLMRTFLQECHDTRRIVLWVMSDNADSITKYEHYGFRRDGLVDQIMFRPWGAIT